jgi:hypothetical protein
MERAGTSMDLVASIRWRVRLVSDAGGQKRYLVHYAPRALDREAG